ncbi:MAG: SUMF1/EgtB/PvdO family nonheme iron enzyme [Fuerstiella sp.]
MTRLICSVWMASVFVVVASSAVAQEQATDSVGTKFRLLEGGWFIQGTSGGESALKRGFPLSTAGQFFGNAEDPAHVTWITRPFYLAETEVTVGQFRSFVEDTGYETSAERGDTQMVGWEPTPEDKPLYQSHDFLRNAKFSWKNPGFTQDDSHPAVGISWADAKAFCKWLSKKDDVQYRLPTEAEWEFACRAGTATWFSFGDKARGVVHRFGNLGNVELERHRKHAAERQWLLDWDSDPEDGHVFTAPVGSYEANAWGLRDMHGNVWEWCEDLWLDTIYKDYRRPRYDQPDKVAVDPVNSDRPQTPANDFHTIRGGSWFNGDLIARSANRTYWDRQDAACYVGFRLARDVGPNASTAARRAFEAELAAIRHIEAAGGKLYSSRGLDLEVRFAGEAFDESALSHLDRLRNLQRLQISWRKRDVVLSQAGLDAIAGLSELRLLDFSGAIDPDVVDLSVLARLPSLQVLKFPRVAPLNDTHLASLADFDSLVEFECFGTNGGLTDVGISQLKNNRQLETLLVWENQATGAFLSDFVECPMQSFASTRMYNGIATLTDKHAAVLSAFPKLTSLTLDGQNLLTADTVKVIGQLSQLRRLGLDRCDGFADEDFDPLADLQRLRELNLSDTNAGDKAAAAIAGIPRIRSVRIGSDYLTDRGVAELSRAFSITELQLQSNSITDRGLRALGNVNRLEKLTVLSHQVTGSGLGPLTRLPQLRDLSLVTSGLTDVAFDYLSQARTVQKLRLAHRGHKPPAALTNEGLMKMSQATWLKELWLPRNDTGITEEKIDELQALMPKTGVIPYTVNWK